MPADEEAAAAAEQKLKEDHVLDNECMLPGPGLIMGLAPHAEEMPVSVHHEDQPSDLTSFLERISGGPMGRSQEAHRAPSGEAREAAPGEDERPGGSS